MKHPIQLIFMSIILLSAAAVHAAGDEPALDNSDYSYGEVVSADAQGVDVLEYDYESDQEKTVRYAITPGTVLENAGQLTDLVKGDTVEVYFNDTNGAKTAQMIIKDTAVNPDDDQTPSP